MTTSKEREEIAQIIADAVTRAVTLVVLNDAASGGLSAKIGDLTGKQLVELVTVASSQAASTAAVIILDVCERRYEQKRR